MKKSVFRENRRYTFSDYFEMNSSPDEIAEELGYSFATATLDLPVSENYDESLIKLLEQRFYRILPKVSLNSEISKREILIAPLLAEVILQTDSQMKIEYYLEVDDKLSGSIDYVVKAKREFIVIEAKKGDIDKGFNQLTAELIAMDKFVETDNKLIYGAITLGDFWRFGLLNRETKHIIKDIDSYSIPSDTKSVFQILLGIAESTN